MREETRLSIEASTFTTPYWTVTYTILRFNYYCESVNLIGSFTVFYLLIDNSCETNENLLKHVMLDHTSVHIARSV